MAKKNITIGTIEQRMAKIVELYNEQKDDRGIRDALLNSSSETMLSSCSSSELWPPAYMLNEPQMKGILKYVNRYAEIPRPRILRAKRSLPTPRAVMAKKVKVFTAISNTFPARSSDSNSSESDYDDSILFRDPDAFLREKHPSPKAIPTRESDVPASIVKARRV